MSSKPKTVLWIAGWAIPKQFILSHAQASFPEHKHLCISATEDYQERIQSIDADIYIGHSLGGLLLLKASEQLADKPCILIAGFTDLRKESQRGGRYTSKEIKAIKLNLRRNPLQTINRFYENFGLALECSSLADHDLGELAWGLDFLANESPNEPVAKNVFAYLGEEDLLTDHRQVAKDFPSSKTLAKVGHCLLDYLPHLKI